jgi:hypothetical protein
MKKWEVLSFMFGDSSQETNAVNRREILTVSNFLSTFALTVINVSAACLPKRNSLP